MSVRTADSVRNHLTIEMNGKARTHSFIIQADCWCVQSNERTRAVSRCGLYLRTKICKYVYIQKLNIFRCVYAHSKILLPYAR